MPRIGFSDVAMAYFPSLALGSPYVIKAPTFAVWPQRHFLPSREILYTVEAEAVNCKAGPIGEECKKGQAKKNLLLLLVGQCRLLTESGFPAARNRPKSKERMLFQASIS
jgi:hypothetical protein